MQTNPHLYHRVLAQLCQWLPAERITRRRNVAQLVADLADHALQRPSAC